jgi:hypothetical protein
MDYSVSGKFKNPDFYFDPIHMNKVGAEYFSKEFAHDLKNLTIESRNIP